jgi:hypothetical protein
MIWLLYIISLFYDIFYRINDWTVDFLKRIIYSIEKATTTGMFS